MKVAADRHVQERRGGRQGHVEVTRAAWLHAFETWFEDADDREGHSVQRHCSTDRRLIEVWNKIATRYNGRKIIWGYDLANEPIGQGKDGKPVWLRDIWPSQQEIRELLTPEQLPAFERLVGTWNMLVTR